jgi:DNA-binding NarL/FixJ family response regulator
MGERPRVIIVEDFALLQETIRLLLKRECDVVATADDGETAIAMTAELAPDFVTVDVSLPGMSGFAVAEKVCAMSPAPQVIFVTNYGDKEYIKQAFEIGARAYVLKSTIDGELMEAIRAVRAGKRFLSARLRAQMNWKENHLTFRASLPRF